LIRALLYNIARLLEKVAAAREQNALKSIVNAILKA
jgi:hypothetical protein